MKKKVIYRIFGMRRSGNHAFISWIRSSLDVGYCFFNNANLDNLLYRRPDESTAGFNNADVLIFSFEDRDLNLARDIRWINKSNIMFTRCYDILLIREPLNLFASRIKSGMTRNLFFCGLTVPLLANHYMNCWQYWEYSDAAQSNVFSVRVKFEDFIASELVRREILSRLKINQGNEKTLNSVDIRYGGGSSFSRGSSKAPSLRDLETRWLSMKNNRVFMEWVAFLSFNNLYCNIYPPGKEVKDIVSCAIKSRTWVGRILCLPRKCLCPLIRFCRKSDIVFFIRNSFDQSRRQRFGQSPHTPSSHKSE